MSGEEPRGDGKQGARKEGERGGEEGETQTGGFSNLCHPAALLMRLALFYNIYIIYFDQRCSSFTKRKKKKKKGKKKKERLFLL